MEDGGWIPARRLIARWRIMDFELIARLKKWGLPAYRRYPGKKIIDKDFRDKYSQEELNRLAEGAISAGNVLGSPGMPRPYTKLPKSTGPKPVRSLEIPKDTEYKDFTMPADQVKAQKLILEVMGIVVNGQVMGGYLFKIEDVEHFEQEHGMTPVIENVETATPASRDEARNRQQSDKPIDAARAGTASMDLLKEAMPSDSGGRETAELRKMLHIEMTEQGETRIERASNRGLPLIVRDGAAKSENEKPDRISASFVDSPKRPQFSSDFRAVTMNGITHRVTKAQAAVFRALDAASRRNPPYLTQQAILAEVARALDKIDQGKKVTDLFKGKYRPIFDALVERVDRGVYRLKT